MKPPFWLNVLLLLLMFALAVQSMIDKSPTFDEQGFLVRGLGYVRNENRWMRVGHPAGLNALNALLLRGDETVRLPTDDPSWQATNFHRPAELFLWEIGNDVERVMFLGRLPTVWLGMVLVAIIGRFTHQLTRRHFASTLAIAFVALDPNILAHTRLATTDLGLVAGAIIATYTLWRFLRQPTWQTAILAGCGFGLLQNTKFTAGLFVPIFALVIVIGVIAQWRINKRFPTSMAVQLLIAYPLAGFLTLWAAYGFDVGTLPETLPALSEQLGGRTLPLAHHIEQLSDLGGRMGKRTPAFLLGAYSDTGWVSYFPTALLLKTPLPTLFLFLVGIFGVIAKRLRRAVTAIDLATLTIPPIGFFAFALTNDINIGYRHILLVVPFIILFAIWATDQSKISIIGITLLAGWLLVESMVIAPDYLAYFNQIAGGADNGWQALVDSNIDWGQDLGGLKRWMDENEVETVRLSYFGEGRPEYYGIDYVGLPSFPPRLMSADAVTHYPPDPIAGVYAISATNLQGVMFDDHDQFAYFREREPLAKIGFSIFIYDVPVRGVSADLALGTLQLTDLIHTDYQTLNTNHLNLRWFDGEQSLLIPRGTRRFVAVSPANTGHPIQLNWLHGLGKPQVTQGAPTLYALEKTMIEFWEVEDFHGRTATFQREGATTLQLHGTMVHYNHEQAFIFSLWEPLSKPTPLKFFVHVEDQTDTIVTQWDDVGVTAASWQVGDYLLQLSELTLNFPEHYAEKAEAEPEAQIEFDVWLGVYEPVSNLRWQSEHGDRLLISTLTFP